MSEGELEQMLLEASRIASKLPKNLQEAGFNRAIDELRRTKSFAGPGRRGKRRTVRKTGDTLHANEHADIGELIDAIDRTAHPDVGATSRVADRALRVLQLARQNHDVDGLSANDIAQILSKKFRLSTKANSVLKALDRETNNVDVRRGPDGVKVFHIMAPGEEYLDTLRTDAGPAQRTARKSSTKQSANRKKEAAGKKATKKKQAKKAQRKNTSGRPGPKAAIGNLLTSSYFTAARSISEIQKELRHRRGHSYSVQELSPALVRSIRDGSLTRERNEEGQYEYIEV